MRIEGWRVDGFGVLAGFEVDGLAPGLTVVLGPNEAGKSTLLDFLRGVLGGFPEARKRVPRHEPLRGGRHGGAVHLVDQSGRRFSVERYVGERAPRLLSPDGDPATEEAAARQLARVDATVLRSVFAFGLTELQALGSLAQDEVRDLLFSAGVLGAGRSATAAVRALGDERQKIVRARHTDARANRALLRLQELDRQLAAAREEARRFPELRTELDGLASAVEVARDRLDAARHRAAELDRLVALWPAWRRRQEALARLSDGSAEAALADLAPVQGLAARIAALRADLTGHEARRERSAELEHSRAVLEEQAADLRERLGPAWTDERVRRTDTSIPTLDAVRAHGRAIAEAAGSVGLLTLRVHEARAAAERVIAERGARTGAGPAPRTPAEIESTRRALRAGRTLLADLARLDQRAAEQEAGAVARDRVGPPGRPAWTAPAMVLALLAGAATVAALVVVAARAPVPAGTALATALLAGAGTGLLRTRRGAGGHARRRSERPPAELAENPLAAERARLARALGDIARALGAEPPFETAVLDDLDAELDAEWRARVREDEASLVVAGARAALDRERGALAEARDEELGCRERWASFAAGRGLGDVTPDGALELLATVAELARRAAALERVEADLRRARDLLDQFSGEVGAVASAAGMSREVAGLEPRAALGMLAEAAEAAARAMDDLEVLRGTVTTVDRQLAEQLGTGEAAGRSLAELASGDLAGWQDERARIEDDLPGLVAAHERAVRDHQDQARHIDRVATSNAVARLELERADVAEELRVELREWWTLGLARALVEETLGRYERERQPAVVGRAASLFAEVTEGRYVHLVPRGETEGRRDHGIEVVDRSGRRIDAGALSRGTVEQLYLCLRLALAEVFAERTTPVPFVLDDVLVNFDPRRAAAVARVLLDVASRAQILLFTCHPHVLTAFEGLGEGIGLVELDRQADDHAPAC